MWHPPAHQAEWNKKERRAAQRREREVAVEEKLRLLVRRSKDCAEQGESERCSQVQLNRGKSDQPTSSSLVREEGGTPRQQRQPAFLLEHIIATSFTPGLSGCSTLSEEDLSGHHGVFQYPPTISALDVPSSLYFCAKGIA